MAKKAVASEARRFALNMKTTERLRQYLEKEAMISGRVLTHEVEYRLERSFSEDGTYTTSTNAAILRDIAALFQLVGFEKSPGKNAASKKILMAALEHIVSAHLSNRVREKSSLSQLITEVDSSSSAADQDTLSVSDEAFGEAMSRCMVLAESVVARSDLVGLSPVVTTKGAPFGFHSNPFSVSGFVAKVEGKPASLVDMLVKETKK